MGVLNSDDPHDQWLKQQNLKETIDCLQKSCSPSESGLTSNNAISVVVMDGDGPNANVSPNLARRNDTTEPSTPEVLAELYGDIGAALDDDDEKQWEEDMKAGLLEKLIPDDEKPAD